MDRYKRRVLRLRKQVLASEKVSQREVEPVKSVKGKNPAFDDVTKADIRELLKAKGVDFNKSDNKVVLYDRLTANE